MRFTAGDVRAAIATPQALVERLAARSASPEATPRSAQRLWIEACLRSYFRSRRSPDVLISEYRRRTFGKGRTAAQRTQIANGEEMLQTFLTWEESEPEPHVAMHPRTDRVVLGHTLSMPHDLVYELGDGYLLREVWTDGFVRSDRDRKLLAAASLAHADAVFGLGRIQVVEAWQLRSEIKMAWPRRQLEQSFSVLRQRLDEIERQLK